MKTKSVRPADRQTVLEQQRHLKMARSAHAYVRGNTLKFYEWLGTVVRGRIPAGPPIWICGDCHLGNLGPVANVKGRVEIAIRDLDQTVIGNPAHDLIRLGLSLSTAARGSDLPGVTTAHALEQLMEGYEEALSHPGRDYKDFENMPKPIRRVLRQAVNRQWRHLAEERIEDVKPRIPLGECFWELSKQEKKELGRLFATPQVHKLVTALNQRDDDAKIRIEDAAYWMKGCSSLGRLRYAVLVRIKNGGNKEKDYCIIDIKEAVKAAAPSAPRASMPTNHAKRVVEGATRLSPFLGERMLPARLLGRDVFMRELMPQDLKLEMDQLTQSEATAAARFLASVVGKAHGRQMDVGTRKNWLAELRRNRMKELNSPSWLWTSVVELVSTHEAAYLEHCRLYAMKEGA